MARVTTKGIEELKNKLEELSKQTPAKLEKFVKIVGIRLRDNVKILTPVKTGHLRRNIFNKDTGKNEQTVYSNVEYAPSVEYGHSSGENSFVSGVYMFKKGKDRTIKELPQLSKVVFNEN